MKLLTEIIRNDYNGESILNTRRKIVDDEKVYDSNHAFELMLYEVSLDELRGRNPVHSRDPTKNLPCNNRNDEDIYTPVQTCALDLKEWNLEGIVGFSRAVMGNERLDSNLNSGAFKEGVYDSEQGMINMPFSLDTVSRIGLQEMSHLGVNRSLQPPSKLQDGVTYKAFYQEHGSDDVKTAYIKFGSDGLTYWGPDPKDPGEQKMIGQMKMLGEDTKVDLFLRPQYIEVSPLEYNIITSKTNTETKK